MNIPLSAIVLLEYSSKYDVERQETFDYKFLFDMTIDVSSMGVQYRITSKIANCIKLELPSIEKYFIAVFVFSGSKSTKV